MRRNLGIHERHNVDELKPHPSPSKRSAAREHKLGATARSFAILEHVASSRTPVDVLDIIASVKLPKATAYRLVDWFVTQGYLAREPGRRRLIVGPKLANLAFGALSSSLRHDTPHVVLQRLVHTLNETCNIGTLLNGEVVYLDRVEAEHWPLRLHYTSGSRVPLHCSAIGKLFLALAASPRRKRLLIAEDNEAERMSVSELLSHPDIEIDTADTGQGALDKELAFRVRLGEVYETRLNDIPKAIETYREVTGKAATHKGALLSLARLHEQRGEKADAAKVLETVLDGASGDEAVKTALRLADLYGALKQDDDVRRVLERGLEADQAAPEIRKRLLYVQAVDTARCLESHVLTDPQDGDVGSIMGLGFAPQTGGAISLIDQVGVKQFVAECDDFAKKYGKQFEVPKLLRDMAAKGESFYGKRTAKAA